MSAVRPPRYDMRIRRKGGYQWASETDAEGLRFWVEKNSSSTDERYREKNQKDARNLSFWLAWREENPTARWEGERNRAQVTALMPLARPLVHQWEPRPEQAAPAEPAVPDDDSNVPF